jgi:hypothetical protein
MKILTIKYYISMNLIDHIFLVNPHRGFTRKMKRALLPEKPEKGLRGGVMNNQQGLTINPYW